MIKLFIGHDKKEEVAYHVLCHSIMKRASSPVSITPLMSSQLKHYLWRERDPKQSTDFSFSRFLVPFLSDYEGWSVFMDCDMLCLGDITQLWKLGTFDPSKAVAVVKHDYVPKQKKKFLGNVQTKYKKKNWSSVMVFNNAKCKALTPEYVNRASGLELHQFKWLDSEHYIDELPASWNYLIGETDPTDIKRLNLIHYTNGTPCFKDYADCQFSQKWFSEFKQMKYPIK